VQTITHVCLYAIALLFVGVAIGFVDAGFEASPFHLLVRLLLDFVLSGLIFVHLGSTIADRPRVVGLASLLLSQGVATALLVVFDRPPHLDLVFALDLVPGFLALVIGTFIGVSRRNGRFLQQARGDQSA
jgi:hypothetical protein